MKKPLPTLTNDAAAENFVAESNLTRFDLSALRPHSFEFAPKSKQVNMRFPEALLDAVKAKASAHGGPISGLSGTCWRRWCGGRL